MKHEYLTDAVIGGALVALGGERLVQALADGNAWATLLHCIMFTIGVILIASAHRAIKRAKR